MARDLVHTRMRYHLVDRLDDFAVGVQETRVSGYKVTLTTPVHGEMPRRSYAIEGAVFKPVDGTAIKNVEYGISNRFDAVVTLRASLIPPQIKFVRKNNGHLITGYTIEARGRTYAVKEMTHDQGEIMFILFDTEIKDE